MPIGPIEIIIFFIPILDISSRFVLSIPRLR